MKPSVKKYLISAVSAFPGLFLVALLGTGYFSHHGNKNALPSDECLGYIHKAQHEEAISCLTHAMDKEPNDFNAYNNRGLVYLQTKKFDLALADYNQALRITPKSALALTGRGLTYLSTGQYDLALKDADAAVRVAPQNPAALAGRGVAYSAQGSYEKAIDDFDEAIRLDGRSGSTFMMRGIVKLYSGHAATAGDDLATAVEKKHDNATAVMWLHLARLRTGQDDQKELEHNGGAITGWPAPVIRFYEGKIPQEEVFEKAKAGDADALQDQACDANFYLGELDLQKNMKDEAKNLLGTANKVCPMESIEKTFSGVDLKALGP